MSPFSTLLAAALLVPLTSAQKAESQKAESQKAEAQKTEAQKAEVEHLAEARAASARDLSDILEPVCSKHELPALGALVMRKGKVTAIGATGLRKRGSKEAVTTDDRWHLGSCTKAMTATLIAVLVEKGELSWNLTLKDAFDGIEVHEDICDVTLRQLLAHRGGLLANPMVKDLWQRLRDHEGSTRDARAMMAVEVLALRPAAEPGSRFLYSNTGYMLAGAIAERATGKSWETLIQEQVFDPLGMKTAGFGPPGDRSAITQPRAHSAKGLAIEPGPLADNPAALGPAGTVHASLEDWAKFIRLHLRGARGETGLLLKPATFKRLHTPFGRRATYALGWGVADRPWSKGVILTHNGSNTMWYAVVWAAAAEDFAVLVTCNQGGRKAQKACDVVASQLISARRASAKKGG